MVRWIRRRKVGSTRMSSTVARALTTAPDVDLAAGKLLPYAGSERFRFGEVAALAIEEVHELEAGRQAVERGEDRLRAIAVGRHEALVGIEDDRLAALDLAAGDLRV